MTKTAERILRRRLSGSQARVFEWKNEERSAAYAQHRSTCQKSGFTFSLHSFRYTFLTILSSCSVPSHVIAALSGYSMRFGNLLVPVSEESKRQAMDSLELSLLQDIEPANSAVDGDADSKGGEK